MKANELRLGNLVYGVSDRIEKVTHITEKEVKTNLLKLDAESQLLNFNDIRPIPLTEEWLLKFGFEFNHQNEYWKHYQNDKGFNISQWVHPTKFAGFEKFGAFYYGDSYLEVKYVHTFQNLYFALTGEELEVKS